MKHPIKTLKFLQTGNFFKLFYLISYKMLLNTIWKKVKSTLICNYKKNLMNSNNCRTI